MDLCNLTVNEFFVQSSTIENKVNVKETIDTFGTRATFYVRIFAITCLYESILTFQSICVMFMKNELI